MNNNEFVSGSGEIFKDFGFDELETKSLQFRSYLMNKLIHFIDFEKLTQNQAAQRLGVTQPRISNLVHGKIDLFSTGMLLDMMERAGFPIYKKIEIDVNQFFRQYEKTHQPIVRHAISISR